MDSRHNETTRLAGALAYASDVGFLGLLQGLTQLRGLILLPVIVRVLGPGAYGVWTQALTAITIGSSIVDLMLRSAVVRFVAGASGRREQRAIFMPALVVVSGLGVLAAALTALVPGPLATYLLGDPAYGRIAGWLGTWVALTAISNLGLHLLRGLQFVKLFGSLSTARTLLQLALAAGAILLTGELAAAVYAAIGLELGFAALVLTIGARRIGVGWAGFGRLRPLTAFSLPLLSNYTAAAVLSFADRLVIASLLGAEAVGIYAGASSLARLITQIFRPIQTALLPAVSRAWDNDRRQEARWILSNTLRYYLLLALPALVGLTLLGPNLLGLLATHAFALSAGPLIGLLGLGYGLNGVQSVLGVLLLLMRDTKALAVSKGLSAALYVALVIAVVPRWGIIGAAATTTVAYALNLALVGLLAWRRERFDLPLAPALKAVASAAVMAPVVGLMNRNGVVDLALAGGVGLALYLTALIALRAVGKRELRFLRLGLGRLAMGRGR